MVLSRQDLECLAAAPTEERRIDVAQHIVQAVRTGGLSPDDQARADDVLRLMTQDAAVRVREALSEVLASVPNVPADVVRCLANDVDRIAAPILQHSPLLSESELIEIVKTGSTAKQSAIASRPHVPEAVARTIVEEASEAPVTLLIENPGAELSPVAMERAVDRFGDSESVSRSLARRADLPVTVAERLVSVVSEQVRAYLLSRPDFSQALAHGLADQSRERAIISLFDDYGRGRNISLMVDQLARTNRLTSSLILRAACTGDMGFLEAAMARLSGLGLPEAWRFLHDKGREGIDAIVAAAHLPKVAAPVLVAALDAYRDLESESDRLDRATFRTRMIQRVLTDCQGLAADDLNYLLLKVDQMARQQAPAA